MKEIEVSRQKLSAKAHAQLQQLRQKYLKRHLQRIMKEKEVLLPDPRAVAEANEDEGSAHDPLSTSPNRVAASNTTPREVAKSTTQRAELHPPAPIESKQPWAEHLSDPSGAAARHKHRKNVMSQTARQLSLEIHNEGIWMSTVLESNSGDDKNKKTGESSAAATGLGDHEFIPWGTKAHNILTAIVCGEIPAGCERILEKHPQAAELMRLQGGQVRCIVTDMRTSLETASLQRSKSLKEQDEVQLKALEVKVTKLNQQATDAEKALHALTAREKEQTTAFLSATEEVKNAQRIQEEFKAKFKSFLGPGMCSVERRPESCSLKSLFF